MCSWPARPRLRKTSLAHIIAAELNAPMVQTAGPGALERRPTSPPSSPRWSRAASSSSTRFTASAGRWRTLYPAMEDRRLPVVLGQGAGARTVTLDLPAFTLIGAHHTDRPADHTASRPASGCAIGSSTTTPGTCGGS